MKKIKTDDGITFEWEPGEEEAKRAFEEALMDQSAVDSIASAILAAIKRAQQTRTDAWRQISAKIEKDTGWDLGRQILDYNWIKGNFRLMPNPKSNPMQVIKPGN